MDLSLQVSKYNGTQEEEHGMIDFKAELNKLAKPELDLTFQDRKNDISTAFASLNTLIAKFNKKQSTIEMQVEEMCALLEQQQETNQEDTKELEMELLVQALIVAADLIEDFYIYAAKCGETQLASQAGLMWRTLAKEMATAGLCRIEDENTPFNPRLNHMEGVTANGDVPEGFITNVLRSGYIYQNKVYRKSGVIVKKAKTQDSAS